LRRTSGGGPPSERRELVEGAEEVVGVVRGAVGKGGLLEEACGRLPCARVEGSARSARSAVVRIGPAIMVVVAVEEGGWRGEGEERWG